MSYDNLKGEGNRMKKVIAVALIAGCISFSRDKNVVPLIKGEG